MKPPQPIQPITERFPALEEQEVVFMFYAPAEAKVVQVAGTFNGWHPEADPLEHTESHASGSSQSALHDEVGKRLG